MRLANLHFWLVLVGQLIFSITMWITGIQQGWMWKATDAEGRLVYRNFVDTIAGNYHVLAHAYARRHRLRRGDAVLRLQRAHDDPEGTRARADRGRPAASATVTVA